MEQLNIEVKKIQNSNLEIRIIHLHTLIGVLDEHSGVEFEKKIQDCLKEQAHFYIINLDPIKLVTRSGMVSIVRVIDYAEEKNVELTFLKPSKNLVHFFEMIGRSYCLSTHETEEDAVQKYVLSKDPRLKSTRKSKTVNVLPQRIETAKAISQNAKSILLIDDDKDILDLLSLTLKKEGYQISTACDGLEAILNLGKENFDLLICDVDMPNLNGFQLIEFCKHKGIKTPVIFLTAKTEEQEELKGFQLGAVDYIKKPYQKQIMLMRIKKVLG
ncbi:MAG: response regulator [Candidatus Brocadiae bacterium]|nr:response regulator [Candidatus Brocadiia bacterium]